MCITSDGKYQFTSDLYKHTFKQYSVRQQKLIKDYGNITYKDMESILC